MSWTSLRLASFAVALLVPVLTLAVPAADWNLDVEMTSDLYDRGDPSLQAWWLISPRVTVHLSPRTTLLIRVAGEVDSHGEISRHRLYDEEDREIDRSLVRFEELLVRIDLGAVDLSIGRQMLAWGRTDGVNATDNLTPRDWTDPLDEQRLSPWAVAANFERGRWTGELVAVPRFAPSRLPTLGGRWFETDPPEVANPAFPGAGPRKLDLELLYGDVSFPTTTLGNIQGAVKGGYRGRRTEWTLSYFRGYDDAAHLSADPGTPDLLAGVAPVRLDRRFPRLDVTGADGVILIGSWALRGEAGYFHFPEGGDDGYMLYEAEVEWNRGSWSVITGYADLEGAESVGGFPASADGADGAGASGVSAALDQAFLPAAFLRVARDAPTEWQVALEAVAGTDGGDRLIRLSGSWPLGDLLRLGGEMDLIHGDEGTFFGRWRENDRLRVTLRMSF
jgi:hypothetical protein